MREPLLPDISAGVIVGRALKMVRQLQGGAKIQDLIRDDKDSKDAAHGAMSLPGISNTQIRAYAQLALAEGLGTPKISAAGRAAHSALVRALRLRDVIDNRRAVPNLARGGLDWGAAMSYAEIGPLAIDRSGNTGRLMRRTLYGQAYPGAEAVYGKSGKRNRQWARDALAALLITSIVRPVKG